MFMPISDLIRLGTGHLTAQQLAAMALEADRESRRLLSEGMLEEALREALERDTLCDLSIAAGKASVGAPDRRTGPRSWS